MTISIQQIEYIHPDKEVLFKNLNLYINKGQKIALTGNNGSGKSTLMQIIAGQLSPSAGTVVATDPLYYIPQHLGQYDGQSIAQALRVDHKIKALRAILNGDASIENFNILNDDWNIEERIKTALASWGLGEKCPSQPMDELSSGEKTRVFLAGMDIIAPSNILLDEPTNHLDTSGRNRLYDFIQRTGATLLVISHDRTLLNLLNTTCELTPNGINTYGGNYEFYKEQKTILQKALLQQLEEKEKELRVTKKLAREVAERKEKQNVRAEKGINKKGLPRIVINNLKNKAENSTAKLKDIHMEKSEKLADDMTRIRSNLSSTAVLKTNFNASGLHTGKILITATAINFGYENKDELWKVPVSFQLKSGERLQIEGSNGCGKTTLLKLITGEIMPSQGVLSRAEFKYIYLNQEYSIIHNGLTILEQAETFNNRNLPEHEIKTILSRYLFPAPTWNKSCRALSGGEKMRLAFCCLMISDNTPDLFILDEPTNNLDIQSIEIITATIRDYTGTVIVVSHDRYFVNEIRIERSIKL